MAFVEDEQVTGSRTYGPFGAVQASAGTQPGLGYQHQWTDPTTGNVNMGARWYQPDTGTFASRDTAALDPTDLTTANRHAYTTSNPLTSVDPTGHNPACALLLPAGPAGPPASGVCFGAFLFMGLASAAYGAGFGIPMDGNSATWTGEGLANWLRNLNPSPPPNSTVPGPHNPGNGTTNPNNPRPGGPSKPGQSRNQAWQPPTRDYHAEQVLANALTPAARPALSTTIAAGVQAAIDAANSQPVIDLGVIGGANGTGNPFKPDQVDGGVGSPTGITGLLAGACQVGGYQKLDPFGGVSRGVQLWESSCAGLPSEQSGSPRNRPGLATMLEEIPDITGKWLQGTHGMRVGSPDR
ncbi:RHS repeat-associated core domain-containing protein [Saccharothrix saharensis]|uniref:RHS repeat-associated core domain-containing protein n=1 Tax=Saccharothrix saharensis TaxID=571190 RepID=UPI0036A4BC57